MFIHALNLYPVKALAGLSLQKALLTSQGLALPLGDALLYDRQWMLINAQGQMVTQRQQPELALIQPVIERQQVYLTAPNMPPVALLPAVANAPNLDSQVWKTPLQVKVCTQLNDWLAQALPNSQLRLVSLAAPRPMLVERFGPNSQTHFADAAPYLVANRASLNALNQALELEGQTAVDERRFRANIWLDGLPAFAEHNIDQLNLNAGIIRLVDHCQRCSVITVDPERGSFCPNAKPFKTLATINSMPNQPKAPAFGVNAVFEQTTHQWISLGDRVS